jgi:hypothetical protein
MVRQKVATFLVAMIGVLALASGSVFGQDFSGTLSGVVHDAGGGAMPGVSVTAVQTESGLTRTVFTNETGSYRIPALPVGTYAVTAEISGFKQAVRRGITLAVAQVGVVDFTLEVGDVQESVTVTGVPPLVNVGMSSTAGLIRNEQIKDLPLQGRSFFELMTLNSGSLSNRSNTTNGDNPSFSIGGSRPDQNRFTINGADYVGINSKRSYTAPQGISGYLLGVEAVQEFNTQSGAYGAEYGKRAGAQVTIVTKSGTNELHGSAFEYLRDSALDTRNYFDTGALPPFRRNQFGGSIGGPIRRNKLFVFATYEGFRQTLGLSEFGYVPDLQMRQGLLPEASGQYVPVANLEPRMLPLFQYWPLPTGPELLQNGLPSGLAIYSKNPKQPIQETYGSVRFDYNISSKDVVSSNVTLDRGTRNTPAGAFTNYEVTNLSTLSAQETHIFSPTLLSVASFGFSKAYSTLEALVTAGPWPDNLLFRSGSNPNAGINIQISSQGTSVSTLPSNTQGGVNLIAAYRQILSVSDDLKWSKGIHYLTVGGWFQRTEGSVTGGGAGNNVGAVRYPTFQDFLQDRPDRFASLASKTQLITVYPEAAWYVQDEMKLRSNFTVRVGLRDEIAPMTYDKNGRNSNYWRGPDGILLTDPVLGQTSLLKTSNNLALWQPRVGAVWDPSGTGRTAVRASIGIHNDLQDNQATRLTVNPPFNSVLTYLNTPLWSLIPAAVGSAPPQCTVVGQTNPPCVMYAPSSVDENMRLPTIYQYTVTLERQLGQDFAVQGGYAGSRSYHQPQTTDPNTIAPVLCTAPAGCLAGGVLPASQRDIVPQGTLYVPVGSRPNPLLSSGTATYYVGTGHYNALNVSLTKRQSHGLAFKASYTWAHAMDTQSATATGGANNEPSSTVHPYNVALDEGTAAYDLTHQFNANFSYRLPFGQGAGGWVEKLIGGWQWNGVYSASSGFPFTPLVGTNRSGDGTNSQPTDVVNLNPNFKGNPILGVEAFKKTGRYFDPNAFSLPLAGTYGNATRGMFRGPGFWNLDTSFFKTIPLNGRPNLQFRMEVFNVLNHTNFGFPNWVIFSGTAISPTAGTITNTVTGGNSRVIQLALRLDF